MNLIGARTLFGKEIRRFLRVPGQTVLSPLVSTTLYFLVFGLSFGHERQLEGVPYATFIVPGLVFLGIANNAFLNSSSSLFIMKIQGTLVDLLVAPMGATELLLGFIGGAMVRGLIVGGLTWAIAVLFTGVHLAHPAVTAFFLLAGAYVFSVLGLLAAMWAEKFEQINFFPTFIMLPLTFLGGVFYSVDTLPSPWRELSHLNPIVAVVDGMRFGMLGHSLGSAWEGVSMLVGLGVVGTALVSWLLRLGYKMKS